jgi:hypothetical protein
VTLPTGDGLIGISWRIERCLLVPFRPSETPTGETSRQRHSQTLAFAVVAIGVALLGIAVGLAVANRRRGAEKPRRVHFQILPPESTTFSAFRADAVSPDLEHIAFAATGSATHLYLRSLNSVVVTRIAGTEGATLPFWSPDGRQLGFFREESSFRSTANSLRAEAP